MVLLPKIDCFSPVTGFSDNCHVGFAPNERHQAFAHNAVIIGDQDTDAWFLRCGTTLSLPRSLTKGEATRTRAGAGCSFASGFRFGFHELTDSTAGKPSFLV